MAKAQKLKSEPKDRGSLYLTPPTMWKLKYIALMDNNRQSDIIEEALVDYFAKWEKKNGDVPPQKA